VLYLKELAIKSLVVFQASLIFVDMGAYNQSVAP
jgi:hypothetical protein